MEKTETLNTIFFYLFLPIVIALSLIFGRLYNTRKESNVKKYQITQGLIIGNIITSIFGVLTTLFLYAYTLNLYPLNIIRWEFLAHSIITILFLIAGIGIGTHIAGVSIEQSIRGKLSLPEFQGLSKILHYFHANLGHKLPFTSFMLITYTLTLLDLFKGSITTLTHIQTIFSIISGIFFGSLLTFIFIITYTSALMMKISIITLISIALASTTEARYLLDHPVALIFTSMYITIIIWVESKKYLPKKILKKFIKLTQSWLKWDGILLHPDHTVFRKIKEKYYNDNKSTKSK